MALGFELVCCAEIQDGDEWKGCDAFSIFSRTIADQMKDADGLGLPADVSTYAMACFVEGSVHLGEREHNEFNTFWVGLDRADTLFAPILAMHPLMLDKWNFFLDRTAAMAGERPARVVVFCV